MNALSFRIFLPGIFIFCCLLSTPLRAGLVEIPDPTLRHIVLAELGKPGGEITVADMESLTELNITWARLREVGGHIESLQGLQTAVNLESFVARGGWVSSDGIDLSILGELEKLATLSLSLTYSESIMWPDSMANLTTLDLFSYSRSLHFQSLSKFPILRTLNLHHSDLRHLELGDGLVHLTTLKVSLLSSCGLVDPPNLSIAGDLPSLTTLDLWGPIVDVAFLSNSPLLSQLSGGWGTARWDLSDFSFLADLPNLTRLKLSSYSGGFPDDLVLPNLVSLDLRYSDLTELSSLEGFPNLEELNLAWCHGITSSIPNVVIHSSLESLNLKGTGLTDVEFLLDLPNLRKLDLSDNAIENLSLLKQMPQLTQLNLVHTGFADASLLAGLPNLVKLDVSYTDIGTLSFLENTPRLTHLSAAGCGLKELALPPTLTNLVDLNLWGNRLTSFTLPGGVTGLVRLSLRDNYLTSFTLPDEATDIEFLDVRNNGMKWLHLPDGLFRLNVLDGKEETSGWACEGNEIGLYHLEGNRLPDPEFTEIRVRSSEDGKSVDLAWKAIPNARYRVEVSSDMANWSPLTGRGINWSRNFDTTYDDSRPQRYTSWKHFISFSADARLTIELPNGGNTAFFRVTETRLDSARRDGCLR